MNRTSELESPICRATKPIGLNASSGIRRKTSSALMPSGHLTSVVMFRLSAAQLQILSTNKPHYTRLVSMQYKSSDTKPRNSDVRHERKQNEMQPRWAVKYQFGKHRRKHIELSNGYFFNHALMAFERHTVKCRNLCRELCKNC